MSRLFHRSTLLVLLALAGVVVLAACATAPAAPAQTTRAPAADAAANRLEIYTSWTTGSDAAALTKLYELFRKDHPTTEILNATVPGGDGTNSLAVLERRLLTGLPPDSFQIHMGHELSDAWVNTGYMEPLDDLYKSEGWDKTIPQGILDNVSWGGSYWALPADIQRANVLWYNKKVLADNNLLPPTTLNDFFNTANALRGKGITPLALGDTDISASTQVFETILIATMGPEKYQGLWTGETDWKSPDVTQALENFKKILAYVNPDHSALTWDQANDRVLSGKAAMIITGDWANAYNISKKMGDAIGWVPAPGNAGVFDAVSDTFTLPRNTKDRANAIAWLKLVGSKAGQEAFNTTRGSLCARTDCNPALFDSYRQAAMQDIKTSKIVPSVAHGSAINPSWLLTFDNIISTFVTKQDINLTQTNLAQECIEENICK